MAASLAALVRVIVVLGLIIALMMLLARVAQKRQVLTGKRRATSDGQIEVLSRRSLGQHVSMMVVRVGRRSFLVGQTSQTMTMLAELEAELDEAPVTLALSESSTPRHEYGSGQLLTPGTARGTGDPSSGAWDAFIERLRELTVRR